jgi:hypothetical protein
MKKTVIKRLVYHSPASGEVFYGGEEYDGCLTDENILGAIHEVGKTVWYRDSLWTVRGNDLVYRITVEQFVQYTKSTLDLLLDAIRRI